jgi:hypothetical protein
VLVGEELCHSAMNDPFFEVMYFCYAMSFKRKNVSLEANFRGLDQGNDEKP